MSTLTGPKYHEYGDFYHYPIRAMIHYKTIDDIEYNLVALQIVKYHIPHVGGLLGVVITK